MNEKIIARVNNVNIVSTTDEQLVAIKPICDALTVTLKVMVANDGKERLKNEPTLF